MTQEHGHTSVFSSTSEGRSSNMEHSRIVDFSDMRSAQLDFFFSRRRRHTRYWRDWSSDVCSSDLDSRHAQSSRVARGDPPEGLDAADLRVQRGMIERAASHVPEVWTERILSARLDWLRSEERRVGKECRSRWSPYH